jgi:low temperature requirement protein LtrA
MSVLADRRQEEELAGAEQQVSPLELFFDLVFVFAITQVTGFIAHGATWTTLFEGLAILSALWFAWESYVWLANRAASDEGSIRVVLLAAMGALVIASLAVPRAFGADGVIFGVAYFAVRAMHLLAFRIVARDDPELQRLVGRLASTILPAAALIVLAGALDGTAQALCWIAALAIDYGGLVARGVEGWRVVASHFAERHGLVIIIALGESIVSVGVGVGELDLDAQIIVAALLGIAVASAMWWAYFDVVARVAERRLRSAPPHEQVHIARDSYTYLHLPMVTGIVLFALGIKLLLGHIDAHLETVPATALCVGPAMYFLALSTFKRRNIGSFNQPRLVAAVVLVALVPVATGIPALLALALVAVVCCALIGYESVRYAEARDRIRHGAA